MSTILPNKKLKLFFDILFTMNGIDKERVNELVIDEWIWVVFIILSLLNIGGDECEKKYCYYNDVAEKSRAKKIFTLTVFVSFLIYFYLALKNCNKYHKAKISNKDTSLVGTRCFASLLVVTASTLFLTAQLRDQVPTNPSLE